MQSRILALSGLLCFVSGLVVPVSGQDPDVDRTYGSDMEAGLDVEERADILGAVLDGLNRFVRDSAHEHAYKAPPVEAVGCWRLEFEAWPHVVNLPAPGDTTVLPRRVRLDSIARTGREWRNRRAFVAETLDDSGSPTPYGFGYWRPVGEDSILVKTPPLAPAGFALVVAVARDSLHGRAHAITDVPHPEANLHSPLTGVRVSCRRTVSDSRSEDELTLEERAEAVVAAFNLRSTLASDWARPAPCELYRVLEEDPDYRTLVTGMRGVGRLPPPEEACSRPWKERSAGERWARSCGSSGECLAPATPSGSVRASTAPTGPSTARW